MLSLSTQNGTSDNFYYIIFIHTIIGEIEKIKSTAKIAKNIRYCFYSQHKKWLFRNGYANIWLLIEWWRNIYEKSVLFCNSTEVTEGSAVRSHIQFCTVTAGCQSDLLFLFFKINFQKLKIKRIYTKGITYCFSFFS